MNSATIAIILGLEAATSIDDVIESRGSEAILDAVSDTASKCQCSIVMTTYARLHSTQEK
jgi:hypothetical protein